MKAARNRWGNLLEGAGKSQFSEKVTAPINPLIPASPSCQVIHLVFKSKTQSGSLCLGRGLLGGRELPQTKPSL